jgi:cell division protein ZapE
MAASCAGAPQELIVKGHVVRVPKAAMGAARFSFDDLCGQPLAAADYLRIAHEFHTVIIGHIPVMDHAQRNEAKRFIILIDTLYDHAVNFVASPRAQPDGRISLPVAARPMNKRTASRLTRCSHPISDYPHRPRHGDIDTTKIVETKVLADRPVRR